MAPRFGGARSCMYVSSLVFICRHDVVCCERTVVGMNTKYMRRTIWIDRFQEGARSRAKRPNSHEMVFRLACLNPRRELFLQLVRCRDVSLSAVLLSSSSRKKRVLVYCLCLSCQFAVVARPRPPPQEQGFHVCPGVQATSQFLHDVVGG